MGLELSLDNIERHLHDVAGIRVICTFQKDIYILADKLCAQDDIKLLARKDYIKNPKPNGYRSLHLIVEIPVFFAEGIKYIIKKTLTTTLRRLRENCDSVRKISIALR